MKKIIVASFLLSSLIPLSPVSANPAAESCLNQQIKTEDQRPKEAQILASVEHEGSEYHMLRLVSSGVRVPESRLYLRINSQGHCEVLLSYLEDSFPSEEVYKEKLGPEVYDKLFQQLIGSQK